MLHHYFIYYWYYGFNTMYNGGIHTVRMYVHIIVMQLYLAAVAIQGKWFALYILYMCTPT